MKIFNWVHRKLKDGSAAQNAKKNGVISDESGDAKQFLVDNNAFGDSVFGCWKGGILTIGTFGYDPLTKDAAGVDEQDDDHGLEFHVNDQDQESEEFESAENDETITDSEEEDYDDEEEEEANPLVYAVYAHDYEALLQYDPAADYIKVNGNKDIDHMMMVMQENDRDVDIDMKKERITLADLFSADHWDDDDDELQKKQSKKKLQELMKEKSSSKKHGHGRLAFAKKLLLAGGGAGDSKDARPIHKLHRLVRRMLKRKIHPELGVLNKEASEKYIPKANESVPLLPITQDGNIGV